MHPGVAGAGGHQPVVGDGDGLDGDLSARGQETLDRLEVRGPVFEAHGFDHLHGDDGVVLAFNRAVVLQFDRDGVGVPGVGDPLAGQFLLLAGEGDGVNGGPALCCPEGELAPAGADFQHPGARPDAGLVQQAVDLGLLRRGKTVPGHAPQGLAGLREQRTGVGHGARPGTWKTVRWRGRSAGRCSSGCSARCCVPCAAGAAGRDARSFCSGSGTRVPTRAAKTSITAVRSSASQSPAM